MAHVTWAKGGDADLVSISEDHVVWSSTLSSPPGSLLDGALVNDGLPIRIKVRGCRREEERFRIEGRIIDSSRSLRLRLQSLVVGS